MSQSLLAAALSLALAAIAIAIHHEATHVLKRRFLVRFDRARRWHVTVVLIVMMAAHVAEIIVFGVGLHAADDIFGIGAIDSDAEGFEADLQDYFYYSFVTYTSLGLGDIVPRAHMRLLTGVEALTGLLMIGWTASFVLTEMREHWDKNYHD